MCRPAGRHSRIFSGYVTVTGLVPLNGRPAPFTALV